MNSLSLFCDVSLNPKLKMGIGVCLFVPTIFLETKPEEILKSQITKQIITKKFIDTSSTKLEIQTVLWSLSSYLDKSKTFNGDGPFELTIYSDSQCVCGLLERRNQLEENNYLCKGKNHQLKHADLYKKFYKLYDEIGFNLIKVKGHLKKSNQDNIGRIFSYVDRYARFYLKQLMKK